MKRWHVWLGAVIVCAAILVIVVTVKSNKGDLQKVSVRLDWLPQAQFAGVYVAKEKGFFQAEGLDVTINPGGVNMSPTRLVASGSDTFGMANADEILVARAKSLPLRAFAAQFQDNPSVFITTVASGIKEPKDFIGKKVGIKAGTSPDILYRAMLAKKGINSSQIKEIPVQFDMTPFFTGDVDVWPGYTLNEALVARAKSIPICMIKPSDCGIYDYGAVLFSTDETLKTKPDMVAKFTKAVLRGWHYAVEHPDEAVNIVVSSNSGLDAEHQRAMMAEVIQLVKPTSQSEIGSMSAEKWREIHRSLVEQGLLGDKPPQPEEAYTLDILTKLAGQ